MHSPPGSVGEGVTFLFCPVSLSVCSFFRPFVRLFVRSDITTMSHEQLEQFW